MKPKYRNGTEVEVGDIAIGCWHDWRTNVKLVATVCVIAIHPEAGLGNNVTVVYLNGKPDTDNAIVTGSSDVLVLMEDAFAGTVDQHPEKPWLERGSDKQAVER